MAIYEFIKSIISALQKDEALGDIRFLPSFSPGKKPVPLNKVTVAVGAEKITVSQGALSDKYDGGEGKDAEISLGLTIYAPYKSGGEECLRAFCRICEELSFSESFYVKSLSCSDVSANREADAFVLAARAVISGTIFKEAEK